MNTYLLLLLGGLVAEFGGLVYRVAPAADHPDGNDSPHASLNLVHRDSSHPGKTLAQLMAFTLTEKRRVLLCLEGVKSPLPSTLNMSTFFFFIKFFLFLAFVHHHHAIICARVPHLPLHLLQHHALIPDGGEGKKHIFKNVKT